MDAREALNKALCGTGMDNGGGASLIIRLLSDVGYRIIHDSENHGPTLERAADHLKRQPSFGAGKWAAALLRAMEVKNNG